MSSAGRRGTIRAGGMKLWPGLVWRPRSAGHPRIRMLAVLRALRLFDVFSLPINMHPAHFFLDLCVVCFQTKSSVL